MSQKPAQAQLIVLAGLTGSGKSLILEHLSSLSYPVIHLEALAAHRGSVFGRLGFPYLFHLSRT